MDVGRLTQSLVGTVANREGWDRALGDLCAYVGAKKALLSLRAFDTADIVVPDNVMRTYGSPLIYGFTETEVGAYLDTYAQIDPWTEIEQRNHPYYPYAMSAYIDEVALRKTEFWAWLEPQGIKDTIVAELWHSDHAWAAINLYLGQASDVPIDDMLDRLREVLPVLKAVWTAGKELELARSADSAIGMVISAVEGPALLVTRDGAIQSLNEGAKALLAEWSLPSTAGDRLVLPQDLRLQSKDSALSAKLLKGGPAPYRGHAVLSDLQSTQTLDGEDVDLLLIRFEPARLEAGKLWETDGLTPRERDLVKLIAQGARLKDAEDSMALSHPRIMQIWKSARTKLRVENANDLRLKHRLEQEKVKNYT